MGRGHVELVHAPQVGEVEMPAAGWPSGARVKVLSADSESGAFTGLVTLPVGWCRDAGYVNATIESIVIDGELRVGGQPRGFGFYEYVPRGLEHAVLETEGGATLLYFAHEAAPDLRPRANGRACVAPSDRIELDTERLPWSFSAIPGPPDGHVHKVLRRDNRTGGMTVLLSSVPHRDYPALEFHDCMEEYYVIEGEVWLGNSGLMTAGSYFWRPPFVTHGPFYSRTGALSVVWVPSALVNHVPDGPDSTPEENLARFMAAGGQRVMPQ